MPIHFGTRLGDNHLLPIVQVRATADDLLRLILTAFHHANPKLIRIWMSLHFDDFTHNDVVEFLRSVDHVLYLYGAHG